MEAPTQVLPSWLTLVTTVVTLPNGAVSTSSATLQLPLTYFGPSIPLGTNGVWVFGGSTPPPTASFPSLSPTTIAMPSATSSQASSAPSATPSSTVTSLPPSSSSGSTIASSSLFTTSPSPTSSTSAAAARGISTSKLGAILGAILGALLILILVLIVLLLRRHRRSGSPANSSKSSSFWNRRTTLWSRRGSRQTPIWTGWEMVNPDDLSESGRAGRDSGERTPGEGSPRGSGEEDDPFLLRRGGTDEMSQTKSPATTLVSVPVAAAVGSVSSHRSGTTKVGGPIIPRDVLLRMSEEDPSFGNVPQGYGDIRVVQPSPPSSYPGNIEHESPLRPPRPLDPDGLMIGRGLRPSTRASSREGASVRTKTSMSQNRSLPSEKSLHNLGATEADNGDDFDGDGDHSINDQESAELLTARRVKVGELGQRPRPRPLSGVAPEPGPSGVGAGVGALGLERLAQLGRMSWFKRLSAAGATSGTGSRRSSQDVSLPQDDPYTPAPLRRQSRQGSNPNSPSRPASRPVSWARLPTRNSGVDPDTSARLRHDSGVGLLIVPGERPISTLSAKSTGSISGNTIYHTPASSVVDVASESAGHGGISMPVPVFYSGGQQRSQQSLAAAGAARPASRATSPLVPHRSPTDPPTYDDAMSEANVEGAREVDILDIPAPRPASPFSAASARPTFPPGLVPLPTPRAWRDSASTGDVSGNTSGGGSAGIQIDVLEEEPPDAQEGWRSLATGDAQGSRRMTFGFPMIVQQPTVLASEQGSLHSMRSHLSPVTSMSPAGSAPASMHTQTGSGSSRPSVSYHSQHPTASSGGSNGHSSTVSSEDRRHHRRRADGTEIPDPPLSAVFTPGFSAHTQSTERSTSPLARPPLADTSTASGTGTVTSSGTVRTDNSVTHSSVTTAMTDPITGTVMHFPRMPWREGQEQEQWDRSRDDTAW
ncbi:hypothetical protein CERSUDRAFT_117943 [Gelatoporia subvermispora B]|uniref:Uncharacterized protein n=1 Tax=Ceriporiopsis subvermispora (strain B) TaxID=914234 RepID=M2Q8Y1_CERS8|nr:hypothetical protein CERSUDRAFT_117943 [Gelatoporia subvermispora B]